MPKLTLSWNPTEKQALALEYLRDNLTTEIFYGGSAGGGKSFLGCVWLINCCLKYPGSRWLMGRAILKNLKASTLLTFFDICKKWELKSDEHFNYNQMEGVIRFFNGSEIYLKDLFLYPSDPEFDSLGSTEFTGAFIDEGSQISNKAKNIVTSRIRYKLEEFGVIPKILIASNPSKNFLYYDFYKPWKDKQLPNFRAFVPAFVWDNPHISPHYIESLKRLDKVSRERLLEGNFEYDDDPAKLMEYDKIIDIFTTKPTNLNKKYMTVDVARFGSDKTDIFLWTGLFVYRIISREKQATNITAREIASLCQSESIPRSQTCIDEDGVGGGVVDQLENVIGFVNNSKPTDGNYSNLKTQCYFMLADYINTAKIGVYEGIDQKLKEMLIEELEQVKRKDADKDGKIMIVPKDKIKEIIGRSPDLSDSLMMRMYLELKGGDSLPPRVVTIPKQNRYGQQIVRGLGRV